MRIRFSLPNASESNSIASIVLPRTLEIASSIVIVAASTDFKMPPNALDNGQGASPVLD